MKTAMQLMLEDLELRYKVLYDAQMLQACAAIEGTIEYAKSLIIKEKEQIIIAFIHNRYVLSGGHPIRRDYAEEYYNQTYNQDRITISETRRSIEGIGILKKQSEGVEWWWKNQNL